MGYSRFHYGLAHPAIFRNMRLQDMEYLLRLALEHATSGANNKHQFSYVTKAVTFTKGITIPNPFKGD